jgi:serine/threonine protein kinase
MPFMVLEWLDGRSLGDLMEDDWAQGRRPWPLPLVVEQLSAVAQALEVAHRSGVAHRDVKPGNIFVLGGQARVPGTVFKLLDFGVAKMMADDTDMKAALAKTGHNLASFTPQYGAPEQFNRKYDATGPWTDVFALATVAVELLSGHMALEGDDVVQLSVSAANPAPTGVPLPPGSQGAERCDWVSLCDGPSPTVAGEPAPGPEVAAR